VIDGLGITVELRRLSSNNFNKQHFIETYSYFRVGIPYLIIN